MMNSFFQEQSLTITLLGVDIATILYTSMICVEECCIPQL